MEIIANGVRKPDVIGAKGFGLPGCDLVSGTAIDYKHPVLLGVVKMLMSYWFHGSFKAKPFRCALINPQNTA